MVERPWASRSVEAADESATGSVFLYGGSGVRTVAQETVLRPTPTIRW
jgi:hypothetical protein